jgi:heme-degrading monooxygenase HmoA
MIVRIWRVSIDQARADEYLAFAHTRSLPMFRAQAGFNGVMFARREGERAVITFWRDISAVDALSRSESYQATVSEIEGKGFTQGDAFIELFEIEGAFVDPLLTDGC